MSNSTQNKRGGYPYEDADFYPKYQEVCQICGISSFAHRHKAGSKPIDFDRLPEASKTKKRASGEDIPKWSERLQKAYDQGYADARREVMMEVKEAISKLKIITPEREPPRNKLTQNQIFAGGQINMLVRLNDALATLREEEHEN